MQSTPFPNMSPPPAANPRDNMSPPLAAKASPPPAANPRANMSPPLAAKARGRYARLPNHDYAGWGYYMVTFSTEPRRNLFSRIENYMAILTEAGRLLEEAWLKTSVECPQITLLEYAVMPDHFHGIVVMRPGSEHPLGYWINRVKGRTTHALRKFFGNPDLAVWEVNYHDYNSLDAEMFRNFREYVAGNARRRQLREENRHLLRTVRHAVHPRLTGALPSRDWDCLGDLALLDYPRLLPVVVHRHIAEEEEEREIARIVHSVQQGAVPIGGFVSPGERKALQAIAQVPRARVIRLLPFGLKEFTPHGRQMENIATSRLLILSAFPEAVEGCHYDNCHLNNDIAHRIAAQMPASQAPGSRHNERPPLAV